MRSTYAQGRHYVCLSSSDPIILQASNISRSSLLPTMQWSLPMEVPSLVLVLKSMWDRGMDGIWDRVFWLFMVDRLRNLSTSPCLSPQSLQIGWVTIGWVTVVNLARGRHGRIDHLIIDVQASWVCSCKNNVVASFNRTRWKLTVFIYLLLYITNSSYNTKLFINLGYVLKKIHTVSLWLTGETGESGPARLYNTETALEKLQEEAKGDNWKWQHHFAKDQKRIISWYFLSKYLFNSWNSKPVRERDHQCVCTFD